MSVVPREPKIPKDRYNLPLSSVNELPNVKKCIKDGLHKISSDYWKKDKDDLINCKKCDFCFKKGHRHLLPENFLIIEK